MNAQDFAMWYSVMGVLVVVLNGAIRKLEADFLLALAWFLIWWMTPVALLVKLYDYQPVRRARIYLQRNF